MIGSPHISKIARYFTYLFFSLCDDEKNKYVRLESSLHEIPGRSH